MDDITKKILEELVINFISEMNEWPLIIKIIKVWTILQKKYLKNLL